MNSDVTLTCCQPDAGRRLGRAGRWLAAYEERFSRFRPLSELSRLNAAAGRPFRASPGLFRLVALALELARRSDGGFDPTVLPALAAAGYDRSFELITPRPDAARPPSRPASWRDVRLDEASRTLTLPAGGGIDLGGIGKGWAVDRLAAILGTPCLVNGGGDVFAAGTPPDEPAWRVGVADPLRPEQDLLILSLADRSVATSSSLRRSWRAGDAVLHHIIDPRTGRPSASEAVQVTAVTATALWADYYAKVALLLGCEAGLAYLDAEDGVEGVIVGRNGAVLVTAGLEAYR